MRRLALVLASCLVAGAASGSTIGPSLRSSGRSGGADAGFSGVYVATPKLARARENLPDSIYRLKAVYGVYPRLDWNVIEPAKGVYDWTTLDAEVTRALRWGKKIAVNVTTGGLSPAWLYSEGVEHATFTVDTLSGGAGSCLTITMPMPWDPIYQQEYAAMMSALAAHLQVRGMDSLEVVKINPMTDDSEEMHLPYATGPHPGGCPRVSNAVKIFQKHNYRPSKVIAAWKQAAQSVALAFPRKVLGIAIWDANDFPLIDENGDALKSRKDPGWVDVTGEIVESGIQAFPGHFLVSWEALGQSESSPIVIRAGRHGAIEGWQSNMQHPRSRPGTQFMRASCDAPPGQYNAICTKFSYRGILDHGIETGAKYIEIWPGDALAFPKDLLARSKKAHG